MPSADDQPITRKEFRTELQIELRDFRTEIRAELQAAFKTFGETFGAQLTTSTTSIITQLREEFDAKLAATKTELKSHTEEAIANNNIVLLQAFADIIEPMQSTSKNHEQRITRLEQHAA